MKIASNSSGVPVLTIIVCSRSPHPDSRMVENIAATAGVPYELLWIDNSDNRHSIFSAYNSGVDRASGDIVCFCHEDIFFHTSGWGAVVCRILADARVGLVGVYGFKAVSDKEDFRVWSPAGYGRILQGRRMKMSGMYVTDEVDWANMAGDDIPHSEECVALDGLFMAARREVAARIRFDESFGGFHLYDFDISVQMVHHGYKVMSTTEIFIEHYSPGNFNESFMESNAKFLDKWRGELPLVRGLDSVTADHVMGEMERHHGQSLREMLYMGSGSPSRLDYRYIRAYLKWRSGNPSTAGRMVRDYVKNSANISKYRLKLFLKYIVYRARKGAQTKVPDRH